MEDVCIKSADTFSYFGVVIDKHLKMDIHLRNCLKRTYGKLYVLGKIRSRLDKISALNLFKCMVLPYIEYGNSFFVGFRYC